MSKTSQKESIIPPLWILTLLGVYGLWWLVSTLREIVMLLTIGYIVAFNLDPVLDWLERKKVRRSIGFLVVFSLLTLFIALVVLTAIPPFVEDLNQFIDNFPSYSVTVRTRLLEWLQWASVHIPGGLHLEELEGRFTTLPEIHGDTIRKILGGFFAFLLEGYSITLTVINLALLPFIVYYLAMDIDEFHSWVLNAIPKKSRKIWQNIFREINYYVRAFYGGQTIVCTLLFLLYSIGFWIIGLKQWFFLGVVAGYGNLIPYFGTIMGLVLSTTLSLVTYGTFESVLCTWAVFAVVQFLEGMVITPKIVGDKVGLSPLLIILSIVIGGKLFGILGIFLAVPGAASLRVLMQYGYQWLLNRLDA